MNNGIKMIFQGVPTAENQARLLLRLVRPRKPLEHVQYVKQESQ